MFEDLVDYESKYKQFKKDNAELTEAIKDIRTTLAVMLAENFTAKSMCKEAQILLLICKDKFTDDEWEKVNNKADKELIAWLKRVHNLKDISVEATLQTP